jgi:hypothetical protein
MATSPSPSPWIAMQQSLLQIMVFKEVQVD